MYHEIDQTLPLVAAMFGAEFIRVEMTDDTGLHFIASHVWFVVARLCALGT